MSRKATKVICIILAALLLLGIVSAAVSIGAQAAVTQSQIDALESERDEIRSQQDDLQDQIDDLEAERASVLEQKEALDEQNVLNLQQIALIEEQIALYDEMIEEKAQEVEDAKAAEEAQFEHYCDRVRTMEETNSWSYLSVLLKATSLSDFLSRYNDIADIVRSDQNVKAEYIAAREAAEQTQAEYEAVQAEQLVKREELLAEEEELEAEIEKSNALVLQLEDDIDAYEAAYGEKESEWSDIQARIDEMVAELQAQKEAEAAAKAAFEAAQRAAQAQTTTSSGSTTTTTTTSSGYYSWPVPSCTYITSLFGYRVHPILGTTKYHAGVDIGASYGANICAAAGGTVQVSEYSSSYGYYCVIYHSNGTTTLYAHMNSMPVVSVGETVTQGQLIGYVGSTGLSTGAHCHFEVRVNGSNVDPLDYFSGMSFSYASDIY